MKSSRHCVGYREGSRNCGGHREAEQQAASGDQDDSGLDIWEFIFEGEISNAACSTVPGKSLADYPT